MSKSQGILPLLRELIVVLKVEKEVLMKNESGKLMDLVEKKKDLMALINEYSLSDLMVTEELRQLISQMQGLQETNLLLTKQGLSFQENIMKALAKNNTSKYSTYSSKGSYQAQKEVKLVDQSV